MNNYNNSTFKTPYCDPLVPDQKSSRRPLFSHLDFICNLHRPLFLKDLRALWLVCFMFIFDSKSQIMKIWKIWKRQAILFITLQRHDKKFCLTPLSGTVVSQSFLLGSTPKSRLKLWKFEEEQHANNPV